MLCIVVILNLGGMINHHNQKMILSSERILFQEVKELGNMKLIF